MAIHRRLTDEFELVYLHDEVLSDLPNDMVGKWHANGRNIEDLDLARCADQPTIFKCRPLATKYEHLREQVVSGAALSCWQIFKHHVKSAKNCTDENGKPLLEWEGDHDPTVKDKCREDIPADVVADIAMVICGKSEEASAVFTLPGSFWEIRARSRLLRVTDAESKDAETKSE